MSKLPLDTPVSEADIDWLRRFLNCSVFGPPPSEVSRAHTILDAILTRSEIEPCSIEGMIATHRRLQGAQEGLAAGIEAAARYCETCTVYSTVGMYYAKQLRALKNAAPQVSPFTQPCRESRSEPAVAAPCIDDKRGEEAFLDFYAGICPARLITTKDPMVTHEGYDLDQLRAAFDAGRHASAIDAVTLKDAERYRHLRAHWDDFTGTTSRDPVKWLDGAIDDAMAKAKPATGFDWP